MKKLFFYLSLVTFFACIGTALATESLDAKYDTGDDATYTRDTSVIWAQTFTALTTANFPYADILVSASGCSGSVVMDIRTTSAGVPSGNAGELATGSVDCSTFSTTAAWTRFTFSSPASLTSGTLYSIVMTGATIWAWRGDSTSPTYADGRLCYDNVAPINGESFVCLTTDELMFRTYKTDAAAAVSTQDQFIIFE